MPTDDKGLKAIEAKIFVYANFAISFFKIFNVQKKPVCFSVGGVSLLWILFKMCCFIYQIFGYQKPITATI